MASLLSRFKNTVVGSNSSIADYKSRISSIGDFRRITNLQVILNSWSNILLTPRRSYMFDPEYGSNLYRLVFEPADEKTRQQIIDEVVESLRKYDDRATIVNMSIDFLPNRKGFTIAVDVEYEGQTDQVEVAINDDTYFNFYESSSTTTQ